MRITTIEETFQGAKIFPVGGRYLRLLETVNPIDVALGIGSKFTETLEGVEAGAWARLKEGLQEFTHVRITTPTLEAVKFVVTDGEAGYDRLFTAFAQARTLALPGNVSVGVAEGAVLAAATRSKVIFLADAGNAGTIYLGPVGVTSANGPVELAPGDMWIEEIAASAAWRGIATVAAQTLRVMTAV